MKAEAGIVESLCGTKKESMRTKTIIKKWFMPNIIWIVPLICCFLNMLGVEGLPDFIHAIWIGALLELIALAAWGIYRLLRNHVKS